MQYACTGPHAEHRVVVFMRKISGMMRFIRCGLAFEFLQKGFWKWARSPDSATWGYLLLGTWRVRACE
jgi:hypothetical protein